jgi:hypothetical protein
MNRYLPLLVLCATLTACGTETGNPEFLEFEYNATSSDPATVRLGESEGGTAVDTVWLRLGDVSFTDCAGETRGTLQGIGFADHGGEEAALQSIALADVDYCGLQTQLFVDPNPIEEPEAIAGSSVSVSGVLTDGRSFRITSHADLLLELDLQEATIPTQGAWLLAFDLAAWIDDSELKSLPGEEVIVDSGPVLQAFEESISSGATLIHDANENGLVDDGEPKLSL